MMPGPDRIGPTWEPARHYPTNSPGRDRVGCKAAGALTPGASGPPPGLKPSPSCTARTSRRRAAVARGVAGARVASPQSRADAETGAADQCGCGRNPRPSHPLAPWLRVGAACPGWLAAVSSVGWTIASARLASETRRVVVLLAAVLGSLAVGDLTALPAEVVAASGHGVRARAQQGGRRGCVQEQHGPARPGTARVESQRASWQGSGPRTHTAVVRCSPAEAGTRATRDSQTGRPGPRGVGVL